MVNHKAQRIVGKPYQLMLLVCLVVAGAFASCRTSSDGDSSGLSAFVPVWQDVTIDKAGQKIQCVGSKQARNQICAFDDTQRGLIWSSRMEGAAEPLLFSYPAAREYCRSLHKRIQGNYSEDESDPWRLPTQSEYEAAVRDESGALRHLGMVRFGDESTAFGRFDPHQSLWTSSESANKKGNVWVAQRLISHFIFSEQSVKEKLAFRCVRNSPNFVPSDAAKADATAENTRPEGPRYTMDALTRVAEAPALSDARDRVILYLRESFTNHGFDTKLLAKAGDLLIAPSSGFIFSESSQGVVNDQAAHLKDVLSTFVATIKAVQTIENKKIKLQVIGYASPSYLGEPQVGFDPDDAGSIHNRIVGMQRAEYIVRLLGKIVGDDGIAIEKFSKGSEDPIPSQDPPEPKCGSYSCEGSRRVIIRFQIQ